MVRRGGYREKFGQRLGIYDHDTACAPVEAKIDMVARSERRRSKCRAKLANALRTLEPDLRCVLTTTTTTGFALARKNAPQWIEVMYTPLDYWPIMRRAFSVIYGLCESFWLRRRFGPISLPKRTRVGIPLALVNARLSPHSERRYRQFRFFIAPTFRLLDLVCVPEKEDADRWAALGVLRDRIRVTGSIKYDPAGLDQIAEIQGIAHPAPFNHLTPESLVLFGGSTHRGEEEILATVFLRLRQQFPSLRLFIAPRHVERLHEIRAQLDALRLHVALASEALTDRELNADCLLLDTTGELQRWYGIATVVFMGKSLTAHGGQNPVEPILAGKPVVFGPHMENFATLAKMLVSKNGAIQVHDVSSLEQRARRASAAPPKRASDSSKMRMKF